MVIATLNMKSHFISLSFLALLIAICILFIPLPVFSITIVVLVSLFMVVKYPKLTMIALGVFLIFQDYIAFQTEQASFLNMMLKRSEEVLILTAFLLLISKKIIRKEKWRSTVIDFPLICLVIVAILSSVKNHLVPYKLAGFDLFLLLKGFFVFYIFYNLNLNIREINKITKIFLGFALLIFLLGIIDVISPEFFKAFIHNTTSIDYRFGISSVQSIFIHPGIFGWFMAFFASFSLAFFIILNKKRYLFVSALFILGAILSMRFKSMVGLLLAISVAFVLTSGAKKIRLIFIVGLLILSFWLIFGTEINMLFNDKVYDYLQSPNLSNQARNVLYTTSIRIARDFFPLGSGLATFGGWISAFYYSPLYIEYGISSIYGLEKGSNFICDTFWPYLIAQFGVIGTACYGWILLSLFNSTVKIFKRNSNLFLKAFALGTLMILIEAIVEAIAGPLFLSPPLYFFIFACLGITYSLAKQKTE